MTQEQLKSILAQLDKDVKRIHDYHALVDRDAFTVHDLPKLKASYARFQELAELAASIAGDDGLTNSSHYQRLFTC